MSINLFDISGRKALVTGAGQGIGRVLSLALAEAGCDVAILEIDKGKAEAVAEEIRQQGHRSIAIPTDVSKKDQVDKAFIEVIREFQRLDICVNNAGLGVQKPAEVMDEKDWDKVIDTNLKGVFFCSQAAGRIMIPQQRGSIINIASMSGIIVNVPQKQAVYNLSKAGVTMLSKSLAVEWAQYGIRVNSLSPGYINTVKKALAYLIPEWESLIPLGRIGSPEELCGAVIYMASDASSYMTGHNLVVDGGYTAR